MSQNKDPFDYTDYVGVGHNSAPDDLLEITKLAEAQFEAQKKVDKLTEELKDATTALRNIAEKQLPEAMDALGVTIFTTTSGIAVKVSEKIRASLAPEHRPAGFAWLEENGYGAIIKSEVVVAFSRNEIEDAKQLVDALRVSRRLANLERKVEPSTLTAFIKEQLAQGKDIPLNIFGVYRQRVAKVEV